MPLTAMQTPARKNANAPPTAPTKGVIPCGLGNMMPNKLIAKANPPKYIPIPNPTHRWGTSPKAKGIAPLTIKLKPATIKTIIGICAPTDIIISNEGMIAQIPQSIA